MLGRGGQGEVYLAEDTLLKRLVAVKFSADADSPTDRLLAEARSASQLEHPNIARVYEAGVADDGRIFVVMEYVEGESLAQALRRGPLPIARAREVVGQVLDALGEAHRRGIVHRDIKPQNIMLPVRGGVKVLDFGLAKRTTRMLTATSEGESTQSLTESVTPPGLMVGTPAYMSPEQLRGEAVDGRSDLFACGVVLYECVTGRRPFEGQGALLLGAILHETPEPASRTRPDLGTELDPVLQRALQKKPEARFQSALEMAAAVRTPSILKPHGPRIRRFVAIAVMLLVAVLGGWWLTRPEEAAPRPAAARWYQQGLEALRDGTYYNATRAFEKLTEADPGFALGHARLAEAWTELDSPEKAQRELLLAKRGTGSWRRRSPAVEFTVAAIEDLVLRNFSAAVENYRRLLKATPSESQAGVWLDLGRAQEKANDNTAAIESYTQAIQRDPDHAAPWLLRGIVQGRRQQFPPMRTDFRKAQSIYEASQNFEGQAELAFQQGRLATMAKDLPTARAALERAFDLAGKTGSEFHQVRALTQLSIVTYMEGNAAKAQELSSLAITRARAARMPFLTVQGLVDLGNAELSRLDLKPAEANLREAVALARSDGLPRSEARARMSLGSVLVQAVRDQEAIPEINAAVAFYSKGQSRAEINMSRALLGRVYRRRGEFAEVHRILGEILHDAEVAGDNAKVSDTVGEIANLYAFEEKFVDAMGQFERRLELVRDSKAVADIGYSLTGKAAMLLRLGVPDQAKIALDEAQNRAGTDEGVARRVKMLHRELLYSSGQWAACAAAYADALAEKQPSAEDEVSAIDRQIECLAFAGKADAARRLAASALERARQMTGSQAAAWLHVAAALVEPDASKSADLVSGTLEYFRKREQFESLWMAEAVAAGALRRRGDVAGAASHAQASVAAWKSLEARLGAEYRQKYEAAPFVTQYHRNEDLR